MKERILSPVSTKVNESVSLHPEDVLSMYEKIKPGIVPEYLARMIMLYPNWRREILTPGKIGQLIWYFDREDPTHISWKLTKNGKKRRVEQVAQTYLSIGPESLASEWEGVSVIEGYLDTLRERRTLSPLIIVRGSRYPDNPDSSFIDGVHRSLAIAIYNLITPNNNLEIDTYVGRKASLPRRLLKRVIRE